jgi:hypothetical protein
MRSSPQGEDANNLVFPADCPRQLIFTCELCVSKVASTTAYSDFPAYSQILLRQLVHYLRTVIVTAAVYRGFGSPLRVKLTAHLNLPAPGRRQTLYFVFRLSRVLCFW